MFHLTFYVPVTHIESVKEALFSAGAGRIGNYEQCCWQTLGTGQFRALPGAKPHVGEIDQLTRVDEYKVEMVCEAVKIQQVVKALRSTHPYEEPAYHVLRILDDETLKSP